MPNLKNKPSLYYLLYRLGICDALTQTTDAEQRCLLSHAQGRKQLVEIGVWHGVNTRHIRSVMSTDAVLYAVDPFFPGRWGIQWQKKIALLEAKKEQIGTVVWLEDLSEFAVETFSTITQNPIDFLFIDGDHSYEGVKKDWELWSPLVSVEGRIALHDSRSHSGRIIDNCGAARFTRDVILKSPAFEVVDEVDSLTVVRKLPAK